MHRRGPNSRQKNVGKNVGKMRTPAARTQQGVGPAMQRGPIGRTTAALARHLPGMAATGAGEAVLGAAMAAAAATALMGPEMRVAMTSC